MALQVREIMNTELFGVRAAECAADVLVYLRALGITSAPVLDDDGRPLGFVALSDLVDAPAGASVTTFMSSPVDVVREDTTIRAAAALMARRARHHLVCVDVEGRALGFISLLDVVRGLIGAPPTHPETFPHYDRTTGLQWTDPAPVGFATIESAPAGPGQLVFVSGLPDAPDRVVWSETSEDVRARLHELATRPGAAPQAIRDAALRGHLWYRVARIAPWGEDDAPAGRFSHS